MQTLFALVNGDNINQFLQNLGASTNPFLARIYVYSYVFLCMWVALNILLAIVGDGYKRAREHLKTLAQSEKEAIRDGNLEQMGSNSV